ncbi:hypothetical protein BT69DRAFT_981105 [Atractiella rhizophila]|nr:hypothetical protein BT69DRAFT_981105 [Atractiella rhizophila]
MLSSSRWERGGPFHLSFLKDPPFDLRKRRYVVEGHVQLKTLERGHAPDQRGEDEPKWWPNHRSHPHRHPSSYTIESAFSCFNCIPSGIAGGSCPCDTTESERRFAHFFNASSWGKCATMFSTTEGMMQPSVQRSFPMRSTVNSALTSSSSRVEMTLHNFAKNESISAR